MCLVITLQTLIIIHCYADDELTYTDAEGNLVVYNVQTDTEEILLSKDNQVSKCSNNSIFGITQSPHMNGNLFIISDDYIF